LIDWLIIWCCWMVGCLLEMNWKECGRKRSWPVISCYSIVPSNGWRNQRKSSVMISVPGFEPGSSIIRSTQSWCSIFFYSLCSFRPSFA